MTRDSSTLPPLGRRLRGWLDQRQPQLSDEAIAAQLGMSLFTLRAWIRGDRVPRPVQVVAIGEICGLPRPEIALAVLELAGLPVETLSVNETLRAA